MAKFASHMGDPHVDPQTSPQHADPYGLFVSFSLKKHQIHVDRRVVGWSAGRHVDHPCGKQISPWPARKVTETEHEKKKTKEGANHTRPQQPLLEGGHRKSSCLSQGIAPLYVGDKFGESLVGSQAPPSFWEVPGLIRKFPELPRKFSATSPEVLSLWNLTAIQRFPGSFPDFPGSSPNFPGSSGTSPEVSPFLWEA